MRRHGGRVRAATTPEEAAAEVMSRFEAEVEAGAEAEAEA